jgi:predicted transcriptional regulator
MQNSDKKKIASQFRENYEEISGNKSDVKIIIADTKKVKMPASIFVFQKFASYACRNLNGSENTVLMYFLSISEFENMLGVDILTISEHLNMSERTTIRALNKLESLQIIIKANNTRDRRRNDYFINPMAAWRGNSISRKDVLAKMNKEQITLPFGDTEKKMRNKSDTENA